MSAEKNLSVLLKNMRPILNSGVYIFATLTDIDQIKRSDTICEFKEKEGITIVMEKQKALEYGLPVESIFAWITLEIHSSLDAVGLTAAFSNELAKFDISCNVIAGYFHDHIFVGQADGERAIKILERLSGKKLH